MKKPFVAQFFCRFWPVRWILNEYFFSMHDPYWTLFSLALSVRKRRVFLVNIPHYCRPCFRIWCFFESKFGIFWVTYLKLSEWSLQILKMSQFGLKKVKKKSWNKSKKVKKWNKYRISSNWTRFKLLEKNSHNS